MLNIRPVSDLRNKYPEIEEAVLKNGEHENRILSLDETLRIP